MTEKKKSEVKSLLLKTTPMCFVNIMDKSESGSFKNGLFLEASHEFEQNIINHGYLMYNTTVEPYSGTVLILFDLNNCEGDKFTKDELVHLAWELEKDFDFKIACKVQINPDEESVL